jgi:hypothetical protein
MMPARPETAAAADAGRTREGPSSSALTLSQPCGQPTRTCETCQTSLAARRRQAKFCSPRCRTRAWRLRVGCERCRGHVLIDAALAARLRQALDGNAEGSA